MNPRQLFALAVRLVGLAFLYHGFRDLPAAFVNILTSLNRTAWAECVYSLILLLWPIAVAYWFFRGAPPVTRIAYPEKDDAPTIGFR